MLPPGSVAEPAHNGMLVSSQLLHEKVASITRDTVSLAQGPLCLVALQALVLYLFGQPLIWHLRVCEIVGRGCLEFGKFPTP